MIGQKTLLGILKTQIANRVFPRFAIFCGERGSEQLELCEAVSKLLGANMMCFGNKVDDVREMIDTAYKSHGGLNLYVLTDADGMVAGAKNALLKITEEPPENAYVILLLEDLSNTLETIKSRGSIYKLDAYSEAELREYCKSMSYNAPKEIIGICSTPGEVDLAMQGDVSGFIEFTRKTFEIINKVQGANAFKMAKSINLDGDTKKYDLRLFWKLFIYFCYSYIDDGIYYANAIKTTLQSLRSLRINGLNRQMLFDLWIITIRECWIDAND